jgi:hypothetical protein
LPITGVNGASPAVHATEVIVTEDGFGFLIHIYG